MRVLVLFLLYNFTRRQTPPAPNQLPAFCGPADAVHAAFF